ncbi:MAG: hypothetical protein LBD23_04730, partial [Oscillospiraceae bacterium]|nr:hypothetical protein [Oscillospiraceae bacterium]
MKKTTLRVLALVLVAVLSMSLLAACRNDSGDGFDPPEFVFLPEFIALPDGITEISNLTFGNDGRLYFSSMIVLNEDT